MVVECFSSVSGLHNASDAEVSGSMYLIILYIYIFTHLPCIKWHMRLRRGAHLFPSLHHGPQLLHGLAGAQLTHELGLLQLKNNGSYLPVIPSWWSHSASHFLIICEVKIVKSIFMTVFSHIFPAEERCANL